MATWMVHLRIADKLLDIFPGISPVEFIVGNVAPDSGLPDETDSGFSPPTAVSHFRTGVQKANPEAFAEKYFRADQRQAYTGRQFGFYLGYLCHLITDVLWSQQIALPTFRRCIGGEPPYDDPMVREIKENWYALDHKFLREHPGFRAFRVYLGAVGFRNDFMVEFGENAFDNRRIFITDFYLQGKENPDQEYPYLTEAAMSAFVEEAVREIPNILHRNYDINL